MKSTQCPAMRSTTRSAIRMAVAASIAAWVVLLPPAAQARCIITIPPDNAEGFDRDVIPELAGGPDEVLSCSRTSYLRSHSEFPRHVPIAEGKRGPAGAYRSHVHTRSGMPGSAIARSLGFRYPGFTKVYSNTRYTSPVRVYSGNAYPGFIKTYSGPRFTNSRPSRRPRYTGFSRPYRGQRYTGFVRTYKGPRYPGDRSATRYTRW